MGSGASKEELRTRDVVVIGAGYGGIQVKSRVIKGTVEKNPELILNLCRYWLFYLKNLLLNYFKKLFHCWLVSLRKRNCQETSSIDR